MAYCFRDDLLLETGFLCLFVAPLLPGRRSSFKWSPSDISFWLVRWLYFRLTFTTGLTKFLTSSKWWTLTGSDYTIMCNGIVLINFCTSFKLPFRNDGVTDTFIMVCSPLAIMASTINSRFHTCC